MTMLAVWLERSIGLVRAWMPPALGTACGMACVLCLTWGQAGTAHAATVQIEVLDAAGKPVGDAVVFLESAQARRQVRPLAALEMAQQKKQFVPEVLVVPVGSEVRFPNHDTVRHHVYSFSPAKKFELKLYTGTPANPVLFDRPGVVVLGCNIHDQMVGWILVVVQNEGCRPACTLALRGVSLESGRGDRSDPFRLILDEGRVQQ